LILFSVVVIFSADAIGGTSETPDWIALWLHVHWLGIILLPAAYLHFSAEILATTGSPVSGLRLWTVRIGYGLSFAFMIWLLFGHGMGEVIFNQPPAPYFAPTLFTLIFTIYYSLAVALALYFFARAYNRATTNASRRRMGYLIVGALSPALESFPYLLYSSRFAASNVGLFWTVSVFSTLLAAALLIVMAYAVAFFGVSWPDRVVKSRLFKWIMRGPVTAILSLAVTTLVRRVGESVFGATYSALVPISMVMTILLMEHFITLFSPIWEKWLFYGKDRRALDLLHRMEERLLTESDLNQFLEMILGAVCDQLQAPGAYVAALDGKRMSLALTVGEVQIEESGVSRDLLEIVSTQGALVGTFQWGGDLLVPLFNGDAGNGSRDLLGLLGVSGAGDEELTAEQSHTLGVLVERTALALRDRRAQEKVFDTLQLLTPEVDLIQRMRAAGRYDSQILLSEDDLPDASMSQWVKDALTHYWGGPKLTENPLMRLEIVQRTMEEHDGNETNALRSILLKAIERVRPEGERHFTSEWILYNILQMKFLEGKKARDVASRLSVSEADLYRKQRVAIEEVSKAILDMETQVQNGEDFTP
ncbi:MAG: hypothetical protein RBT34_11040, partial [Anaerolineaceae bacterium]|nr:hypothetical protein [Anaerolineaceae bacterium]